MADTSRLELLERVLGASLLPARMPAVDAARDALANAASPTQSLVEDYRRALIAALDDGDADLTALAVSTLRFLAPLQDAAEPLVATARAGRRALDGSVSLGPATIDLAAPSASVANLPVVAHLPIDSLGLAIGAGALQASGAGYIHHDSAGGQLAADLGAVKVTVAALLGSDAGALGVLALLRADFMPAGIQLGLGFSLDSVGGMFGLNRGVDIDTLRRGMADGSALGALFGGGGAGAASIRATLGTLERLFPPARGEVLVGPTLRLGWLNVAGTSLVRLDLGVILALPRGRVMVPGRAVVEVPGPGVPLVHLRADLLGDLDVAGKRLSLDAALVDSQVVGAFRVSGTGAAYLTWADPPVVVLTVGGFFPGFDPRPAQVPPQRRIALDLSTPLPGLQFSAEGYVAVTTGTLQLGGSVTAAYELGIAAIRGTVGGDAMVQLSPLWFTAGFHGKASVEALGQEVASVTCTATVTGPGPLTMSVSASTKILWERVGGTIDFVLSRSGGADRTAADVLRAVVQRELTSADNFACIDGADRLVRRATTLPPSTVPLVDPVGALVWRQDQFPLDSTVHKADGRILATAATVSVTAAGSNQKVSQPLATSAFLDLTDSAALSVPAFEPHDVGLQIPVTAEQSQTTTTQTSELQTVVVPVRLPVGAPTFLGHALGLSAAMFDAVGTPKLLAPTAAVATRVAGSPWVLVNDVGGRSAPMTAAAAVGRSGFEPTKVALPLAALVAVGV